MNISDIILPKKISKGDTVGIFTPSSPANKWFKEKFNHGLKELERNGFNVKIGELTSKFISQGYRSGTPQDRANEFMNLIKDDQVDFLMSTIGGYNSSSMLSHLDYELIREKRKIITGYSDVTALHMGILTQSKLSTFYGPALIPTFGEWPSVFDESLASFLKMSQLDEDNEVTLPLFDRWSNHFRNAFTDEWKTLQREYKINEAPNILSKGKIEAPIIVANLNTICSLAGTKFFPELDGKILLLEEMNADFDQEERSLTQLKLMGVFDKISGLIIGKPEVLNSKKAPFTYDELIMECVGNRSYPIITSFDCGHTHPMHTIPQMSFVRLDTSSNNSMVTILKGTVV